MATHSSVLAWRIPGTGSLVSCRLWGHTESDMTEATQQQQQQSESMVRLPIISVIFSFFHQRLNSFLSTGLLSPSVQFSHSVVSDSLRPHELQHTRPPCPSPTPGIHSDSHPSSWRCHPAISSSVVPFSCPQSLPASESFPMSQLHMRWPKYWSFSFSMIPSKEHPGDTNFHGVLGAEELLVLL